MWKLHDQPWCDLETLSVNREPARAHFYPYESEQAARDGNHDDSASVTCLNGDWRFRWLPSPLLADERVVREPADEAHGYALMRVPLNWQFAGYGRMHYTDEAFPFPVNPPYIPAENETGVYKRTFLYMPVPDKRLFIRFEGVESAFSLYINDVFAGYSQGSRMPSEFDITALIRAGDNTLCALVYQYCDGTYLEDQDMWWLGGIIRDVLLLERPNDYLADLVCDADYEPDAGEGILTVRAIAAGTADVSLILYAPNGKAACNAVCAADGEPVQLRVPGALAWNAEQPYLYRLTVILKRDGRVLEATQQFIGFRRVQIHEGTLLLNGRRIMMRGVNRHEFDPRNGRAVSREQTEQELLFIKRSGMNAVRTSHYPNIPAFYDICDRLGLYVMDECDLETHGFEMEGDATRLANDPKWQAAYVERAERLVARDRNHACVVMWSLGNESGYGLNIAAMYRRIKAMDPGRPVHYEPDRHCLTADVSSSMYTSVGLLHERDLELSPKRPHILCEFAHAMGNGPGALAQYIQTIEQSRRIQGYFIWELKDHGVYTLRDDGTVCCRYGGEFEEDYSSGNFCIDGLLAADGTPSPGYDEYRHLIAPVQFLESSGNRDIVRLLNRWNFAALEDTELRGELKRDGQTVYTWVQKLPPVPPGGIYDAPLPDNIRMVQPDNALWTRTISCHLTRAVVWSKPGHELGSFHQVLQPYAVKVSPPAGPMRVEHRNDALLLTSQRCSMAVSLIDGSLYHYVCDGMLRMQKGPALNVFRPYIDNDRKLSGMWQEQHLHSMRMTVYTAEVTAHKGRTRVVITGAYAPNARNWRARVTITYQLDSKGRVQVRFAGDFTGDKGSEIPAELPKLGTKSYLPKALDRVTYCGLGPDENYCDRREAARMGIYRREAAGLQVPYECPQDNGNRTGVLFSALTDSSGEGVVFSTLTPRDMSIRAQDDQDLWHAKHACDVPERDFYVLHFDMRNSGLGSGSCGPNHLAQHAVHTRPFDFSFAIAPIRAGDITAQAREAQGYLLGLEEEETT